MFLGGGRGPTPEELNERDDYRAQGRSGVSPEDWPHARLGKSIAVARAHSPGRPSTLVGGLSQCAFHQFGIAQPRRHYPRAAQAPHCARRL